MSRDRVTESHPSFGRVVLNRTTGGNVSLFDSEIRHNQFVTLTVHEASRERDLNRDWIYPGKVITEIWMSEAQWASMVSSFSDGGGTSCTLHFTREEGLIPQPEFSPRLQLSQQETRAAAHRAFDAIKEARDTYEAHKTAANLRNLHFTIENATANVDFAAKTLTEHTENVVQKARADIEAMVVSHAERLGIDPAGATAALALEAGSD